MGSWPDSHTSYILSVLQNQLIMAKVKSAGGREMGCPSHPPSGRLHELCELCTSVALSMQ